MSDAGLSDVRFHDVVETLPHPDNPDETFEVRTVAAIVGDWVYAISIPVDARPEVLQRARQMAEEGARERRT